MKKAILCFLVSFFSITAFCQHPYKQNLKGVATIILPDTPKITKTKTGVIYSVTVDGAFYLSQMSRLHENGTDMLTPDIKDSVYAEVIKTTLETVGTIFYKKQITSNGLHAMEFGFKKQGEPLKISYSYYQVFFFNDILIINRFRSDDSLRTDDKKIKAFFSTFKLSIPDKDIEQGTFADVALSTRTWVISILVMLAGILIMYVVYIIKKRSYSN